MPTFGAPRNATPTPVTRRLVHTATALWRSPRARGVTPWLFSLLLHAGVFVGAAVVVWRVRSSRDLTPPLVVSFDEPAIAPSMAHRPAPAPEPDPADALERILAAPVDALAAEAPALPALPAPPALTAPPTPEPVAVEDALSEPATVEFSGLGVSDARDIVYVVDASGSMITTLPTVLDELERSIRRLHPIQRFQVFLFHSSPAGDEAHAFEWPALLPGVSRPVLLDATRGNKAAAIAWARTVSPHRRSNPLPALEAALAMNPDAVFLLSAGATDTSLLGMSIGEVLDRLDRLNPARRGGRPVVIRAIQILDDDPAGLLRRVAAAHGGENGYKFIGRDDLTAQLSPGAPP